MANLARSATSPGCASTSTAARCRSAASLRRGSKGSTPGGSSTCGSLFEDDAIRGLDRLSPTFTVIGRLRSGVSIDDAQRALTAVGEENPVAVLSYNGLPPEAAAGMSRLMTLLAGGRRCGVPDRLCQRRRVPAVASIGAGARDVRQGGARREPRATRQAVAGRQCTPGRTRRRCRRAARVLDGADRPSLPLRCARGAADLCPGGRRHRGCRGGLHRHHHPLRDAAVVRDSPRRSGRGIASRERRSVRCNAARARRRSSSRR